jgi:hypothetical protein
MYVQRNTEARSPNHSCRRKAVSITYWSVCARACISAYSLANSAATRKRHVVTSFAAPRSPPHFSALSYNRCNFWKKSY